MRRVVGASESWIRKSEAAWVTALAASSLATSRAESRSGSMSHSARVLLTNCRASAGLVRELGRSSAVSREVRVPTEASSSTR